MEEEAVVLGKAGDAPIMAEGGWAGSNEVEKDLDAG
jgi:hypothetical protein